MEPSNEQTRRARRAEAALVVLATVAGIGALKIAHEFFVPLVVGILGAYALRPIVSKLASWKVPEPLAAAIVMVALVGALGCGAYALRDQATSALADLPHAAHSLRLKLHTLANGPDPTPLAHVKAAADELKKAASEVSGEPAPPPAAGPGIVDRLAADGVNALGVLTTLGVALAITLFLLAAGNSFRRKLLRVGGNTLKERRITVEILDEIDVQVQRYLLVMLSTNVALGLVFWGTFAAFGLAALAGLALVAISAHWWLLAVGAAAILAAWFYTGGKRPYGYRGLGEVGVFVFFGLVATLGTTYTQAGRLSWPAWAGAIGTGLLACALLMVNNLRDIPTDAQSGKRTLAVRLGDRRARIAYQWLVTLPILLGAACAFVAPWSLLVLLLGAAVAVLVTAVRAGARGIALVPVLAGTGLLELGYGVLLGLGLAL